MRARKFKCKWKAALAAALAVACAGCTAVPSSLVSAPPAPAAREAGYRGACRGDAVFVAVGTGGRIDRIAADKTVTALGTGTQTWNGIVYAANTYVAVGDDGAVAVAKGNAPFEETDAGVTDDLLAVACFGDVFVAAGSKGALLVSNDARRWEKLDVGAAYDFVALAATADTCIAVTREGQVLVMRSLDTWDVLDYNETYKNLSTQFHMRMICGGESYLVAGTAINDGDAPVLFGTANGEIWTEKNMEWINGTLSGEFRPIRPNAAAVYDDQVLIAADEGKLLTLTSCAECTKLTVLSENDITDLAVSDSGDVLLVGDGFWYDVLSESAVRMYKIQGEQAQIEQENGAVIVDVRTADEYAGGHVPGSLNIPVNEIEEKLPERIPDAEATIIFYCAAGMRSQTALEAALAMGYARVYNMGGLDSGDWPYELAYGPEDG